MHKTHKNEHNQDWFKYLVALSSFSVKHQIRTLFLWCSDCKSNLCKSRIIMSSEQSSARTIWWTNETFVKSRKAQDAAQCWSFKSEERCECKFYCFSCHFCCLKMFEMSLKNKCKQHDHKKTLPINTHSLFICRWVFFLRRHLHSLFIFYSVVTRAQWTFCDQRTTNI